MSKAPLPLILLLAGLAAIYCLHRFVPSLNFFTIPLAITGLGLAGIGLFLALAGAISLRMHGTTVSFSESTTLVTSGIFRITRNPMYLSIMLTLLGAAFWSRNAASLAVPLLATLWLLSFIPKEEAKMEKEFGEEYVKYRERTPRWL